MLESWSDRIGILAAVLALVAFFLTRQTARLKDEELKRFQASSRVEVAKANADAALANQRAGALEVEAATARERAANAERALLDLQLRTMPRRLAPAARDEITKRLGPFKGVRFHIMLLEEAEAHLFGKELSTALRDAGWSVDVTLISMITSPQYGLLFSTSQTKSPSLAGQALIDALKTLGFEVAVSWRNVDLGQQPGVESLFVGLKPVIP